MGNDTDGRTIEELRKQFAKAEKRYIGYRHPHLQALMSIVQHRREYVENPTPDKRKELNRAYDRFRRSGRGLVKWARQTAELATAIRRMEDPSDSPSYPVSVKSAKSRTTNASTYASTTGR